MKQPSTHPTPATAGDVRLYHRLQMAAHAAQKQSDRSVKRATGLTTAQVSVMTVVAAGPTVTQRDVADALGVNESAVTAMVQRLEALGCVRRGQHSDDARAWALQLTDDGKKALTRARGAFASVNRLIDETLSVEEISGLALALERLTAAFAAHREDAP